MALDDQTVSMFDINIAVIFLRLKSLSHVIMICKVLIAVVLRQPPRGTRAFDNGLESELPSLL